ncbi:uncharacterized protein G2W53_018407 [Senna tora]|uniref:F-box domain-containing protein n=1 Tax=Senna tora TaxID=362788 RepID=A0A834TRZ2_9FABA|nr:uncharacterized protein G2W53_018407 [Senna tora]
MEDYFATRERIPMDLMCYIIVLLGAEDLARIPYVSKNRYMTCKTDYFIRNHSLQTRLNRFAHILFCVPDRNHDFEGFFLKIHPMYADAPSPVAFNIIPTYFRSHTVEIVGVDEAMTIFSSLARRWSDISIPIYELALLFDKSINICEINKWDFVNIHGQIQNGPIPWYSLQYGQPGFPNANDCTGTFINNNMLLMYYNCAHVARDRYSLESAHSHTKSCIINLSSSSSQGHDILTVDVLKSSSKKHRNTQSEPLPLNQGRVALRTLFDVNGFDSNTTQICTVEVDFADSILNEEYWDIGLPTYDCEFCGAMFCSSRENSQFDASIVLQISQLLDSCNPLVKQYQIVKDRC